MVRLEWAVGPGHALCIGAELRTYARRNVTEYGGNDEFGEDFLGAFEDGTLRALSAVEWRIPIAGIIEEGRREILKQLAAGHEWVDDGDFASSDVKSRLRGAVSDLETAFNERPPSSSSEEPLAEAARVYLEAEAAGLSPTKTVAEVLFLSPSAARGRVARARTVGLLPANPGRGRRRPAQENS